MTETAETPQTFNLLERVTDFEFVDITDPTKAPVHVTHHLRINGQRPEIHLHPDEPAIVRTPEGMRKSELLVRLVVLPTDIEFTEFPNRPGVVAVNKIGGIPVLTPPDGWSYVGGQPAAVTPNSAADAEETTATLWVEVWVQARSVSFTYDPIETTPEETKPQDTEP